MASTVHPDDYGLLFDAVDLGLGHAIMVAVAGSGKTTTLIEGSLLMDGSVAYCVCQ